MAATVGATLSTVAFPLRHAGMGPFKSSAGNFYWFGRDTTNTGTIEPHKATDPMSSFTAGTQKTMSSATTTAIEAGACYQVADVIHIATQISTGATYYNSYNMATDAWTLTTSETAVAAASFAPGTGYTSVSLVVRSGGEVVIVYCAGLTAMSSGFNMVRYTRRTATNTFSAPVNVDNGGSNDWSNGIALLGASDRVHSFLRLPSTGAVYQRTLTAANALQTFPSAYHAVTHSVHSHGPGITYVESGSTKVALPYKDTGQTTYVATLTSADAPTPTGVSASDTTTLSITSGASSAIHTVTADSSTLHLLTSDLTTSDLFHDTNPGTGWGADVNELAGTINRISSNVYDRSGTKLAMVVDDGGTIKYAEITLATPSLIYPTNDVLTQLRRR